MYVRLLSAAVLLLAGCHSATSADSGVPPVSQSTDEDRRESKGPTDAAADDLNDLGTRSQGVDWPYFLGPSRDSKSPETELISPWPEAGPRILWQHRTNTGYGIGSISKGRYFHFDRFDETIRRPGKARLTCLAAETGEKLWQFEYPTAYQDMLGYNNGPRCSPVVDGNRVYIVGAEGMLHCVRASDGEPIWKVDTTTQYGVVQNFFGVGSTPVVEADLLICMIGGSPAGSPALYESNGRVRGNGTGIVAFDKYTGQDQYRITDELASYAGLQLATIDNRRWCFAFARGGLVGFDPTTGKVDFHYPWRASLLESVNASNPVVIGNEVFISETYEIGSSLLTVRPGGFDVVWHDQPRRREKSMKTHWNTPIYVDGYLYGCNGRNEPDADLRCIEWKTGKVQWIEQAPREVRGRSSLLYVDGHFICLGEYGSLKLIKANPKKYELISEISLRKNPNLMAKLPDPYWSAPVLSHGLLYVHGEGRLLCLELIRD